MQRQINVSLVIKVNSDLRYSVPVEEWCHQLIRAEQPLPSFMKLPLYVRLTENNKSKQSNWICITYIKGAGEMKRKLKEQARMQESKGTGEETRSPRHAHHVPWSSP